MEQFVPKLPHLTRLDEFIIGSTLLVFLALAHEVATFRLLRMRRPDLAFRVDRIGRTAFPAAFVAICSFAL
jgi:hypothetical protein